MQNAFRSRIWLIAVAVVGVSLGAALPKAHFENSRMEQEANRERTLAAQGQATFENAEQKTLVVRDLLAQKITLTEAATRFEELHKASPFYDEAKFQCMFEGANNQERYCRQVMMHAKAALRHESDIEPEVSKNLEEQFDEIMNRIAKESK